MQKKSSIPFPEGEVIYWRASIIIMKGNIVYLQNSISYPVDIVAEAVAGTVHTDFKKDGLNSQSDHMINNPLHRYY